MSRLAALSSLVLFNSRHYWLTARVHPSSRGSRVPSFNIAHRPTPKPLPLICHACGPNKPNFHLEVSLHCGDQPQQLGLTGAAFLWGPCNNLVSSCNTSAPSLVHATRWFLKLCRYFSSYRGRGATKPIVMSLHCNLPHNCQTFVTWWKLLPCLPCHVNRFRSMHEFLPFPADSCSSAPSFSNSSDSGWTPWLHVNNHKKHKRDMVQCARNWRTSQLHERRVSTLRACI